MRIVYLTALTVLDVIVRAVLIRVVAHRWEWRRQNDEGRRTAGAGGAGRTAPLTDRPDQTMYYSLKFPATEGQRGA